VQTFLFEYSIKLALCKKNTLKVMNILRWLLTDTTRKRLFSANPMYAFSLYENIMPKLSNKELHSLYESKIFIKQWLIAAITAQK